MKRKPWQERYQQERVWSADPNPWLVELVGGIEPGTSCDVGCGEGTDAVWLAERGWQVSALDFAPAALERGRQAAQHRGVADLIQWHEVDLAKWEPPTQKYDLVSVQFFHAEPAIRELVHRKAWQATRGTLLIAGHDISNATEGHRGPPAPVLYSAENVLSCIEDPAAIVQLSERRARYAEDPERVMWDCVIQLQRS